MSGKCHNFAELGTDAPGDYLPVFCDRPEGHAGFHEKLITIKPEDTGKPHVHALSWPQQPTEREVVLTLVLEIGEDFSPNLPDGSYTVETEEVDDQHIRVTWYATP